MQKNKNRILTEGFSLDVEGVTIRGECTYPQTEGVRPTLLPLVICHGIPRSRQTPRARNEGYREIAQFFAERGFLSIIFNFRGTGMSGGSFDLWGWGKDLESVLTKALSHPLADVEQLSLLGFSGGAATSCITAARRREVKRVMLMACPADFDFLFDRQSPTELIEEARSVGIIRKECIPKDADNWVEKQRTFKPVNYIHQLAGRSLLLVHGVEDDVVPVEHARRLHAAAEEPKELVLLPQAAHQLRTIPAVLELCHDWLKKASS